MKDSSLISLGLVDLALVGIAGLIPPLPFVIFISSLYFCFDPYYFVLGDVVGDPDFENVSFAVYFTCFLLRACLTFCAFESIRTITLAGMVIMHVIDTLQDKFCDILTYKIKDVRVLQFVLGLFLRLSIIFKSFKYTVEEGITIQITVSFWFIVVAVWVIIKARPLVPLFMYIMTVVVFVVVYLCAIILLKSLSNFYERSENMTSRLKLSARQLHTNSCTVLSRHQLLILKLHSRAFLPIRICFCPFLLTNREFCMNTASNLFDRIFDAILIF